MPPRRRLKLTPAILLAVALVSGLFFWFSHHRLNAEERRLVGTWQIAHGDQLNKVHFRPSGHVHWESGPDASEEVLWSVQGDRLILEADPDQLSQDWQSFLLVKYFQIRGFKFPYHDIDVYKLRWVDNETLDLLDGAPDADPDALLGTLRRLK
ncbi:hypothetical protein [Planctomicrobium piriforme]|uniref:Lipocalin-like domain-containing protein n=1 Tax=Planctomicrobium piriforme TaxID=1576369 RepID=A0A1I3L9W6_9PLAN|nr:hypothetical protein [Planctomicrobium piriforme]SFI81554.1 hypothetical protein SAMN05421753_112190 [Planctomicrobium piriforme]